MKKTVLYFAALICMLMQSVSTFASDRMIPAEQLPAAAKAFIQKTFPGQTIAVAQIVKIDKEPYGFEVVLSNDLELKFNKQGQLVDIDD